MGATGLLISNLGTPDSASVKDVKSYLKEFLNDPRVIDVNPVWRHILVNWLIIPGRAKNSAKLYREIWTDRGSPLLFHSLDLMEKVRQRNQTGMELDFGMRYGNPGLLPALSRLKEKGVDTLLVFPLYPQYASSSTGSTMDEVHRILKLLSWKPEVKEIKPFFNQDAFIEIIANNASKFDLESFDHFVFSYHGLPERHIHKTAREKNINQCHLGKCCDRISGNNYLCYRAGCFETTRRLVKALNLPPEKCTSSFQSRLNNRWLKPFTDEIIENLGKQKLKRVLVFSPSFVADCLETTYEIGTECQEIFTNAGGGEIVLVPSLNSQEAFAGFILDYAQKQQAPRREPVATKR
jgi:protoporphyrin/coproporphyrin ferrochelatase